MFQKHDQVIVSVRLETTSEVVSHGSMVHRM